MRIHRFAAALVATLAQGAGAYHPLPPLRATASAPRRGTTRPTAREIVEGAAEAIGGLDRLRAITAVRTEERGIEFLLTVPADGPPRFATQTITTLRRVGPTGIRRTVDQIYPMRPERFIQTTIATATTVAVERSGTMAAGTSFDLETANEDLALTPWRALLTALAAPTLHRDRDTTIADARYHRVSFALSDADVQLMINALTGFPTRVRVREAYPDNPYWAMWGRVTAETVWSSWSLEPSGVWHPRQRTIFFNGARRAEYIVTSLDLAPPAPPDSFAIPDSIAVRAAASAPARQPADPALTPVTLADGMVLFQGGYQATLVREPRGIVVIEAPESDAKSRAVLAYAARQFPGVRVSAVISTSPQWMHVAGLAEYARRGIPLYVLDVNASEVRALLAAPRPSPGGPPGPRHAAVTVVRGVVSLGAGPNRLRLVPVRGGHGSRMMLVYWPAHRLLYASDMIIPPAFEPPFTAAYQADLARALRRMHLDVLRVFALHLPPAAWPPAADSIGRRP